MLSRWLAHLTASDVNRLGQYASSHGKKTYFYAELTVSFLLVVTTIASTQCRCPREDGQLVIDRAE